MMSSIRAQIIEYLIEGANKPRWRIDQPDGAEHPDYIRAIVGHTGGKFVNVEGVEVTEEHVKSLFSYDACR